MQFATVFKLLLASLVVGLLMMGFDLSPGEFYEGILDGVLTVWRWVVELIGGEWGRALLAGATVVVPAWLIFYFVRRRFSR